MEICNSPKISIIVPVYNVACFLPQCIESLICQTFRNIEILLINDGSLDTSGQICDEYEKLDSRIKVIHQNNIGLSGSRNRGIELSTGQYLMFLDSDDWIDPCTCEIAIKTVIEYSVDVVLWSTVKEFTGHSSTNTSIFTKDQLFENKNMIWLRRRMVGLIGSELSSPTKTDALNSAWGKLYRKDLIMRNRVYFVDTNVVGSEDVLFNIQIFKFVNKAFYLNQFLYHYRQDNPNSLTKNHKATLFPRFLRLFDNIKSSLDVNIQNEEYYDALNNRIALSVINHSLSISSSNNNAKAIRKISSIKEILKNETYRLALKNLDLNYFPIHWKLFFGFCKIRFATGVFLLSLVMLRLKAKP